jgi:hypothetical protein
LAAALSGFLLLILLGVGHAFRVLGGQDAVPAFVVAFLLPLVTGALSQLLPVWCHPGRRTEARERMRGALVSGGVLRSFLFLAGGLVLAAGKNEGVWLAAAGMFLFLFGVVRAFFFGAKILGKNANKTVG